MSDHGEPAPGLDDEHTRLGPDVAGYVLGGLSAPEQQAFEAHLALCPTCRVELADLDPLPVLLDLARSDPTSDREQVSAVLPEAVPAVSADPASANAKRRRRMLVGAAAVALALIVGGIVGKAATRTDGPRFSAPVTLEAVGDAATASPTPTGTASWRAIDSGTLVRLDLAGLPGDGTYYECLWISGQGVQSAGTSGRIPTATSTSSSPPRRPSTRAGGLRSGPTVPTAAATQVSPCSTPQPEPIRLWRPFRPRLRT